MSVISIFESEVSCLSNILDLQRRCQNEKLELSTETNKYLLYLTLKKVGPSVAQRVVSKLVEQGEITWNDEEEFEVEQILDHVEDDGVEFYLIKWRGWSHAHNSWEPKENLDCSSLIEEFGRKNSSDSQVRVAVKRKFDEIEDKEEEREAKRTRVDELFYKLTACKETMTPLRLVSLTSPDKGIARRFKSVTTCTGLKVPKFTNNSGKLLNPRTKAYKLKKVEIRNALKEWEKHLNRVNTDPAPICVENDVDLEGPPENFEYINDYKPGPGIEIPNEPPIGCECEDCGNQKSQCCASQFGVEYAYYKHKRLRITPGRPIYECNKICKCGPECSNRVVQQGRKHKVCIFRTKNGRGWGVKAMQKIKSGSFVMEYVGEVISNEEAELRGKMYDSVGRTYLFDLDFSGDDCPFTVDAALYGNVSHFVNHSCDPNLEVYSVWINTLDHRMPRIALFSRRDIEKGEELTFDYMASKPHTSLDETPVDEEILAAPVLERVDATDENGNEMIITSDQSEVRSISDQVKSLSNSPVKNSLSNSPVKNLQSKPDQAQSPTKSPTKSPVKNIQSKSPVKKITSDSDDILSTDKINGSVIKLPSPRKLSSPTKAKSIEAFGDGEKQDVLISDVEQIKAGLTENGPAGDTSRIMPVLSPRKSPKAPARAYRMVCQCGAKNCRKFVF